MKRHYLIYLYIGDEGRVLTLKTKSTRDLINALKDPIVLYNEKSYILEIYASHETFERKSE